MSKLTKFQGCLIGHALADALCAPYEGGFLEKLLWKMFSTTKDNKIRYTDDTQMTIDLSQSLIAFKYINQDALAEKFASSYKWSRGYGPSAARLLKGIKKGIDWRILNTKFFNDGSYGNGAAMRIAPIALFYYKEEQKMLRAVEQSAIITHAHTDAITGAKNIALSVASMLNNKHEILFDKLILHNSNIYKEKLILAENWYSSNKFISTDEVAKKLGNGIESINSTVTAIYIAMRFIQSEYNEMIEFIQQIGGDTDTIAAMSASIWGAKNGINAISNKSLERLESKNDILKLAGELFYLHA